MCVIYGYYLDILGDYIINFVDYYFRWVTWYSIACLGLDNLLCLA